MNQLFANVSHPNDELFGKMSEIISGRFTINSTITRVSEFVPTLGNKVVADSVKAWNAELPYSYFDSRMKQCFHVAPKFAFAEAKQTQETLKWLNKKLKTSFTIHGDIKTAQDVLAVRELCHELMQCVGAIDISKYVKTTGKRTLPEPKTRRISQKFRARLAKARVIIDKLSNRTTCRAELVLEHCSVTNTRKSLPQWSKLYFGDYKRALKFVSTFVGRIHTWFDAWVRAQAGIISKVGLVNIALHKHEYDLKNYPLTLVFLALASSEFSKRKEFTLESQKQGGLNPHLRAIFDEIVENERGGLKYIAYMIQAKEVWEHVDESILRAIRFEWMNWMTVFSVVLEKQWKKGVQKSSRRSMRVLPGTHWQGQKHVAKSGVNSNLWNVVADSWNSGASFMRGIDIVLGEPVSFWGKTLQLVANDQFQWGSSAGKQISPDVLLFRDVTKSVLPWHIVHPDYSDEFDSAIALREFFKSVQELEIKNVRSWLEIPALRSAKVTSHHDMICGCAVPPMQQELFDYLAKSGVFGATGWSGK